MDSASTTAWIKPAQVQSRKKMSQHAAAPEVLPLVEKLLVNVVGWYSIFFRHAAPEKTRVSLDDPTPMHISAVLSRVSGF